MANPKFVPVNLNKSYGRSQPQSSPSSSTVASRFGNGSRGRAGSGGGGGGMVLLPRPRSSGHKVGGRLSVPPPLNLPSLRKEHERQDPSVGLGSLAGAGGGGFGSGHGSAGVGWSKPVFQENDGGGVQVVRPGSDPSAGGSGFAASLPADQSFGEAGRAAVLRGEDFPSLAAASYVSPQKVVPGQRRKQRSAGEEALDGKTGRTADVRGSPPPMRPQVSSARVVSDEKLPAGEKDSRLVLSGSQRNDGGFLTCPLPVVRLMHTSDWADDERDTSHVVSDRSREKGFSRNEYGKCRNYLNGRSGNDPDVVSSSTTELYSVESYVRDLSISGRDRTCWRPSQFSRDGILLARGSAVGRDFPGNYKSSSLLRDNIREVGKQGQLKHMDGDDSAGGTQDLRQSLRDLGYGKTTHIARNGPESNNLRSFQRNENSHGRYGDGFSNKYKANSLQKDLVSKVPYSVGSKGLPLNDSVPNFSTDKHFLNGGKPYMEGSILHSIAPFSDDINLKVFTRKKDTLKHAAFYDPVRDSFEAELEEVQRMQEEERQRVFDEQMQALELARKVNEERERMVREENDRRKRQEDKAREAMQREEQERLEASKIELEAKIAREEEKRKILEEEERRKEAARQKLLELEAQIARRQAEAAAKDDSPAITHDVKESRGIKEGEIARAAGGGGWEDGDQMVEQITSSASSDSSGLNRGFESGSRPSSTKDGNSLFMEQPNHVNSWKNNSYDNENSSTFQENGYHSQQHDAFGMGRTLSRKGFFDGTEATLGRTSSNEGISEFHHTRGHGWGSSGNIDLCHRNSDFGNAFLENDNYTSGAGWGQARQHGSPHSPYSDNLFHSSETDSSDFFGRSRHFTRQHRVLSPPSFSSVPNGSFRAVTEQPSSSTYIENETRDHVANRSDEKSIQGAYENKQERSWHLGTASVPLDNASVEEHENNAPHCDSQSSVSVSSPPISPAHLSHDDLEESQDFSALSASNNDRYDPSDNAHALSVPDIGISEIVTDSSSVPLREEDEWTIENNDEMLDLEEYDEDGDPEDEVQSSDCENIGIAQHFEDLQLSVQDKSIENDQMVLGFNEGIQIKIPDEFERCSGGEGTINKQMVAGAVLDLGSFDGLVDESGSTSQPKNSTFPDVTRKSPDTVDDTEKVLENFVIEPVTSTSTSNNPEAFISTEFPPKHQVEYTLSSQSSLPTTILSDSAVPSQTNASMELQFGLFSGPSLIPSPVPAIQIGSIQMPLHLHPPVGQPIPHMQSSQPPFFQFGQLHYPSPISQGIFPLTQNMPFVQSSVPLLNTFNQDVGRVLHNYGVGSHSSLQNMQTKEKVVGSSRKAFDVPQQNFKAEKPNLLHDDQQDDNLESNNLITRHYDGKQEMENGGAQMATVYGDDKHKMENEKVKSTTSIVSSQLVSGGVSSIQSKAPHKIPKQRGKMYVYTVKNAGSRPQFSGMAEALQADHSSLQRKAHRHIRQTEFRVRESGEREHGGLDLLNYTSQCDKLAVNRVLGRSIRNFSKRAKYVSRSTKSALEAQNMTTGSSSLQFVIPESKTTGREAASKQVMSSVSSCHTRDGSLKSSGISEKVVDAPLQSGIVQIFKQSGIEIPSDEDDFIEVRSKRQMLNDRREQKEKEIKAKSRAFKASRKNRSITRSNRAFTSLNKEKISVSGHLLSSSSSFGDDGIGVANCATSTVCSTGILSQPVLPIGTSPTDAVGDSRTMNGRTALISSDASFSCDDSKLAPELGGGTYACRINTSSDSLNNGHVNQQVMPLTQTQLDDAMKPAESDTHATSISNRTSMTGDQGRLSTAAVTTDKTSSIALSSLLSSEKIQFGAITTPAILPPVSRAVPIAIGPPGSTSCRSDFSVEHNLTASGHDSTIFFEKGKCIDESGAHLEDQDAEAEAAASAVAVAAISNDEAVGNSLAACSVSIPESNKIGGATSGLHSGGSNLQEGPWQSAQEESLPVTLPADLLVETPSLSSWPVFPSSQSSTAPLLSHFPGASSHFPLFDMNSMLGGPVFAIGSHDESAGSQSHPQRSMLLGSGSVGNWSQRHSVVESFYGSPAAFSPPFINPQGGIPGIQAPPQMLFYNPFAPQYSLSIMGASAFVPPGKQPDWKHNLVSSVTDASESDTSNVNSVAGQQNSPSIPSPIQHHGQVSPLLPMASHLPIFDMSTFQSSTEIPVQAQWPHFSGAPLNSVPISVQSEQQHVDRVSTQVVSHRLPVDLSTRNRGFPESCTPATVDGNRNFGTPAAQFPHELATMVTTATDTACILPGEVSCRSSGGDNNEGSSRGIVVNSCETVNIAALTSNIRTTSNRGSVFKTRIATPLASHQHLPPVGNADHRGRAASQKAVSGNEWHRRKGLQRKCQASADRNFSSLKMKQIYVAKQPATSTVRTKEI